MGEKVRNVRRFLAAGNDRCPICWEAFADRAAVTVEHVPPKSLGGRKACLTCRRCNHGFSKIEEFMRRDVQGTTRFSLYEGGRRIAASDVVVSPSTDGVVLESRENPWPADLPARPLSTLAKATSALIETPSRQQVRKAWIKTLYLMAGCARRGEAWNTAWAPGVRAYLRGDVPWDDDLGVLRRNDPDNPGAPPAPDGVVGRLDAAGRSDVFFAAWNEHAVFFGLPKQAIPDDGMIAPVRFQWLAEGPFVYGGDAPIQRLRVPAAGRRPGDRGPEGRLDERLQPLDGEKRGLDDAARAAGTRPIRTGPGRTDPRKTRRSK